MGMAKEKKEKGLTRRQAELVKEVPRSNSVAEAARKAGYSPKHPENAGQAGYQALKQIEKSMPEAIKESGLTNAVMIEQYLKPALKAEKITLFGTQPDNQARIAAMKLWGDWAGVSTSAKDQNPQTSSTVNQQFNLNLEKANNDDIRTILQLAAKLGSAPAGGDSGTAEAVPVRPGDMAPGR
jgi:hypothetical protein